MQLDYQSQDGPAHGPSKIASSWTKRLSWLALASAIIGCPIVGVPLTIWAGDHQLISRIGPVTAVPLPYIFPITGLVLGIVAISLQAHRGFRPFAKAKVAAVLCGVWLLGLVLLHVVVAGATWGPGD